MTNHNMVVVKGRLPAPAKIGVLIREVVSEKWGSVVTVENVGEQYWRIQSELSDSFSLDIWIQSTRTIEMRKGPGTVSSWLQAFVQEHLAERLGGLGGLCGSAGVRERWAPTPQRFYTYDRYNRAMTLPGGLSLFAPLFRVQIPKELLGKEP
jgi:hypothetical protein